MSSSFDEKLVHQGLITQKDLDRCAKIANARGDRLGRILIDEQLIEEDKYFTLMSEHFAIPLVDPNEWEIDQDVIRLIPSNVVRKLGIMPLFKNGNILTIVMSDPTNIAAVDNIKAITGLNVEPVLALETIIQENLDKYYEQSKELAIDNRNLGSIDKEDYDDRKAIVVEEDVEKIIGDAMDDIEVVKEEEKDDDDLNSSEISDADAPVVRLVNGILKKAIKNHVSDIHIEPFERNCRVRYRLDSVLHNELKLPISAKNGVTARLKILAGMNIAEKRLPQDGRIKLKFKGQAIDFRVSAVPTMYGEKIVLRLLDKSNLKIDMTNLGFTEKQLKDFDAAIHRPHGMVLVTGPTGSGKTTTLYSALDQLNTSSVNISTAEDPVEYNIYGINQVQMHHQIGLSFASVLRSFLRQDPDIIMVGEIRDFDTLEIAVKAALTGHLVLSTIHTNNAPSTVTRMLNMGVEPFLVSSSLILVIAQRLVRKICENCKTEDKSALEFLTGIGLTPGKDKIPTLYKGEGCGMCSNTGYKGRIGLYEVMPIGDDLRRIIMENGNEMDIRDVAKENGMMTIREAGMQKLFEGLTTVEEIKRVTYE